MLRRLSLTFALFLTVLGVLASTAATPTIERGEIEGAHYALVRPTKWNGSVLLIAHGLRAETSPLVADLYPDRLAYKTLIGEGWIVAKTSYRRNGVILGDAIKDIDNLRAFIADKIGKPKKVIVEGDSMGGTIATLIAEREKDDPLRYDGIVAVDPALDVRDAKGGVPGISMQPKIPVLFLANQNEIKGPQAYVTAPMPPEVRPVSPVLIRVARDGHVNVNQAERLLAIHSLSAWIDRGAKALPSPSNGSPYFDATQVPTPVPSLVQKGDDGRSFTAKVSEVTEVYGNVAIDAQPSDFESIGIGKNAYFLITTPGGTFRVQFGKTFGTSKRGEWIAFPNADGFVWLARVYGNAADSAKISVGDEITVRSNKATDTDPAVHEP